jgi:hypothetical protein
VIGQDSPPTGNRQRSTHFLAKPLVDAGGQPGLDRRSTINVGIP